jgi:hypothetical protein
MQVLTSFVLAAFAGYAGAWYLGLVDGNFALLLFLATVVTGIYWLAERFVFLPKRQQAAALLEAEASRRREELTKLGISQVDGDITEARQNVSWHSLGGWTGLLVFSGHHCRVFVALVSVRALQDSFRFHDPDFAGGRPDSGE